MERHKTPCITEYHRLVCSHQGKATAIPNIIQFAVAVGVCMHATLTIFMYQCTDEVDNASSFDRKQHNRHCAKKCMHVDLPTEYDHHRAAFCTSARDPGFLSAISQAVAQSRPCTFTTLSNQVQHLRGETRDMSNCFERPCLCACPSQTMIISYSIHSYF